ncbi:hypothetical protein U1Q18_016954, partial [Sarracenia purpurea var. burkii]
DVHQNIEGNSPRKTCEGVATENAASACQDQDTITNPFQGSNYLDPCIPETMRFPPLLLEGKSCSNSLYGDVLIDKHTPALMPWKFTCSSPQPNCSKPHSGANIQSISVTEAKENCTTLVYPQDSESSTTQAETSKDPG